MSGPNRPKITKELLERVLAGEFRAARDCYAILQAVIRFRAVKVLIAAGHCMPHVVQDISQETFVALLDDGGRLIRAWDPQRGSFETYSGLIAEQRAIEYVRKKKEEPQGEELPERTEDSSRSPFAIVASKEMSEKLFRILEGELEGQGRRVFELLYKDGRGVREICALLCMSEDAVYQWRSRIGRRLEEIAAMLGEVDNDTT